MTIDVRLLGKRLKQARELRGGSLSGLAARANVSKSYLAKLERGEIENPGLKTLQAITRALELTLSDLLPTPESAEPQPGEESAIAAHERLLEDLPPGLRQFLDQKEKEGERLPADVVRSLASIQFRGKKPQGVQDWQFLYDAITRSL